MQQYPLEVDPYRDFGEEKKKQLPPYVKWVLLALIVVLGALALFTHHLEEKRIEQAKQDGSIIYYLPSFSMYSYEDDKAHSMAEFYTESLPVVLNFWATWCEPCVDELAAFAEVQKYFGDEVPFVMVSMLDGTMEDVDKSKAYIDTLDYDFEWFYVDANKIGSDLKIDKIPTTLLLYGIDGYVASVHQGGMSAEDLIKYTDEAFAIINDGGSADAQ